jgi:hypothetical protein
MLTLRIFYPEVGGSRFLRNLINFSSAVGIAPHPVVTLPHLPGPHEIAWLDSSPGVLYGVFRNPNK